MNVLEKIQLVTEIDELSNQILAGTVPLMQRVGMVTRIDEIIQLLGGEAGEVEKEESLEKAILKHHGLAIRIKPPKIYSDLVVRYVADHSERNSKSFTMHNLVLELRKKLPSRLGEADTYFKQLESDLTNGVHIGVKNKVPYLRYLLDMPVAWAFLDWLYKNDFLIVGKKAILPKNEQDLPSVEPELTANEEFEAEANLELVDPPVDEAGVFYQAIIDGADIDLQLVQTALDYAEEDPEHFLLPEASQVVKEKVLAMVNA